jgi:hypothetical protein
MQVGDRIAPHGGSMVGVLRNLLNWFGRASRASSSDTDFDDASGTRLSIGGGSIGLGDGDRDHDGIPDSADANETDSGDSDGGSDD